MKKFFAVFIFVVGALSAQAATNQYLYKTTLVQAAPGKLLELIDLFKARATAYQAAGDELPLWMRHSQGDHWDLLILFPGGSDSEDYQAERVAKRKKADESLAVNADKFKSDIAWQEDLF